MAIFIAGCSDNKTPEQIIEQAKTAIFTKNASGEAIVILKKLLQEQAQNTDARELLAITYTIQGDYLEALSQFQRIKDAKISNQGLKYLAETYYFVQAESLIDEAFISEVGSELPGVSFLIALQTFKMNGDLSLLEALSEASANQAISELAEATLVFKETKNPVNYIKTVLSLNTPDDFKWFVNTTTASLLSNIGDSQQAIPRFEDYLDARPYNGKARLLYAQSLVDAGEFEKAKSVLDGILTGAPGQVLANRLKAIIDFENNDLESAKAAIDTSIQNGYTIPSNYIISGTISFQLGNYEQAVNELERGVVMFPPNSVYHKMLAAAALQVGDSERSVDFLFDQSTLRSTIDIQNFGLLLDDMVRSGNSNGTLNLLSSLSLDDKMDIESRMRYLTIQGQHSSQSSSESLVKEFSRLASTYDVSEAQKIKVNLLTAISMLKAQQYNDVITSIKNWENEHDIKIFAGVESEALKLLGRHSELVERFGSRVTSTQDAALLRNIAFSHYQLGQYEQAYKASLRAFSLMPTNIEVLREVVRIQKRANLRNDDDILAILQSDDKTAGGQILLSLYYSMYEEFSKAEKVLLDIETGSRSGIYYYTLAEVQLRLDKKGDASKNAKLAAEQENISLSQTPALIFLLSQLNEQEAAQAFLYKQLEIYPVSSDLKFIAAQDKAGSGDLSTAQNYIDKIENPSAKVMVFHSQLALRQRSFEKAVELASKAYEKESSENALFNLSEMLEALGEKDKAIAILNNYIAEHDSAINPRLLLAEKYRALQPAKAKPLYEEVLKIDSNNIYALTNLATVSKTLGDTKAAKAYAERALNLYPDNEAVKNTHKEVNQ